MTEHLLNHAQVRSVIEKVGRTRVTQDMWRELVGDPGPFAVLLHDQPGSLSSQSATARVEEDRLGVTPTFPLLRDETGST